MPQKINRAFKFNPSYLQAIGIGFILLFVALLLWHGKATSMQAQPALLAQVYFDGEYRIADGSWQEIVKGEHIPSTKGDVTLRGNFHMRTPDGEYIGIYASDIPIALYVDHIGLTFYESGNEPYVMDMENPMFGDSGCGAIWTAYKIAGESEEPIEILIHNPHRFGNEMAIDELLANTALWANIDFENGVLESGATQRNTGLTFILVALAVLGIALFSVLIHIKNSKLLWLFGLMTLFAGIYFAYSASGVSFWSKSIVSNTIAVGSAMMLYMFFMSATIVYLLDTCKKIGVITVVCLGVIDALALMIPVVSDLRFYDIWFYWIVAQLVVNLVLISCLIKECFCKKNKSNWLYIGAILPLIAFGVDVAMTGLGVWKGGEASKYLFILLFAVAMVVVLRIIPRGINDAARAKELETEKTALNAQLTQSRISTMMSQIRPHFIYNTLGSIEQLCSIDPLKAGELVHNFAKYLRGNFRELDNPRPILMSQEMEHVYHYISIENVRFPDMTFLFKMDSDDFHIPALTIQPLVENAIKHGLMKLPKGGTIRVVSYETDTHYCVSVADDGVGFDTSELLDERKHVGIRNIRERLKAMVDGTLEIESKVGTGTKVLITIPKEVRK